MWPRLLLTNDYLVLRPLPRFAPVTKRAPPDAQRSTSIPVIPAPKDTRHGKSKRRVVRRHGGASRRRLFVLWLLLLLLLLSRCGSPDGFFKEGRRIIGYTRFPRCHVDDDGDPTKRSRPETDRGEKHTTGG
jgi:hypothetical protein